MRLTCRLYCFDRKLAVGRKTIGTLVRYFRSIEKHDCQLQRMPPPPRQPSLRPADWPTKVEKLASARKSGSMPSWTAKRMRSQNAKWSERQRHRPSKVNEDCRSKRSLMNCQMDRKHNRRLCPIRNSNKTKKVN
jgi:hypothetical protein